MAALTVQPGNAGVARNGAAGDHPVGICPELGDVGGDRATARQAEHRDPLAQPVRDVHRLVRMGDHLLPGQAVERPGVPGTIP